MPDRILISHAGSLPQPEDLIALNERRALRTSPMKNSTWAGCARPWRTWSHTSGRPASTWSTTASSGTPWAWKL